jgi:hypothetical protein
MVSGDGNKDKDKEGDDRGTKEQSGESCLLVQGLH